MNDLNVSSCRSIASKDMKFGSAERDFVYAVARRIVGTAEAADDVAQDAMLLAYRHRDSFRGDSRYRTWLYRIAWTTAIGHIRRNRRSREQLAATAEPMHRDLADPARSPEMLVGDHETAFAARRAVDQLDPKYRDVVLMRTELTESETATRLGISVANVKIRGYRARQQLRNALEPAPANDAAATAHAACVRSARVA